MRFHLIAGAFCAGLFTLALSTSGLAQPAPAKGEVKNVAPVCANCHEDKWHAIDLSPHGAKNDADGSMCQACHGDATEHLKDPMKAKPANPFGQGHTGRRSGPPSASPATASNRNLAFWTSGKHALNEVDVQQLPQHPRRKDPAELQRREPRTKSLTINKFTRRSCRTRRRSAALPPAYPRGELQAVASPDHRRQDQVLRLPQSARRDHAGDAEAADDQRPVLLVPRRQARSVRVQPPAGRGELRDLPQPARLGSLQAAERVTRRTSARTATTDRGTRARSTAPAAASSAKPG